MAIFGHHIPAISGSLTNGTIYLEHSEIAPDFFNSEVIVYESVLTGHREIVKKHNRTSYVVNIYLTQYTASETVFNQLYSLRGQLVKFWPHYDGSASLDESGSYNDYCITEFKPYYISQDKFYDALLLKFEPTKYSSQSLANNYGYGFRSGDDYGYGF